MSEGHHYRCRLDWSGSTGDGYKTYDRAHGVSCPLAAGELRLGSDPAFLGDPDLLNPEQLLVVVDGDVDEQRVRHFVERAHEACFIANGLRSEITIEPQIEFAPAPA